MLNHFARTAEATTAVERCRLFLFIFLIYFYFCTSGPGPHFLMLQLWSILLCVNAHPTLSNVGKVGNVCKMMKDVDINTIDRAEQEHRSNYRRMDSTLVGENINLQNWLNERKLRRMYRHVHFHAVFEGKIIDDKTPADLFIFKIMDDPHVSIVNSISTDVGIYARKTGFSLGVEGGDMVLANEIRRPDLTVCPILPLEVEDPAMPRFLVEIINRSEPEADAWCRGYFPLIPQLQTALLIKVYSRRVSGYFGALAVLYRRESPDSEKVIVEDAVSFGTEELASEAKYALKRAPEILAKLRTLPEVLVKAGPVKANPWDDACRPFVLLRHEDLFHWKIVENGTRLFHPEYVSKAAEDCRIELWMVLAAINRFADF